VIEQVLFDPTPSVSGQLVLAYADQRNLTGGRLTPGGGGRLYTAELRPAYHFTSWFKIQVDAFFQTFDFRGSDAAAAELWKVTFAPTLVAGRGFLARPELRLFVTWADWNGSTEALGDAAGAPIGSDVFGSDTSGLVFGAHVEAWW
jgi:maltoporin